MERANPIIDRDVKVFGKRKRIRIVSAIDKSYLEKTYTDMARKGWLVDSVKGARDTYKPIEPCDLEFSVSYFQSATPLDFPDYDKEDTYQEFCEDSGWTLAAKNDRYFVYYKAPENKALPIHTEPADEYRTIWDAMKKGELITFPVLMVIMVFQLWMGIKSFRYEDFYRPAGLLNLIYPSLLLIVIGAYMIPLVLWLMKNKSRAKENKPLIYDSYRKVRVRNGLYNSGLGVVFAFLMYSIISIFSAHFSMALFFILLINMIIPVGFGLLLRFKIKKVRSKRSTNVMIMVVGFFVVWALMVGVTFSLVGNVNTEKNGGRIPPEIPVLTHQDLGTNLEFQPRGIESYKTIIAPLSFEYESYHKDFQGDFHDIELTYIEARTAWVAEIIANRAIHDELQRIEREFMRDNLTTNYVYSLDPDKYGLDIAYNLSKFNSRIVLVKDNVIYFIQLDSAIDEDVLEKIILVLFGENE